MSPKECDNQQRIVGFEGFEVWEMMNRIVLFLASANVCVSKGLIE